MQAKVYRAMFNSDVTAWYALVVELNWVYEEFSGNNNLKTMSLWFINGNSSVFYFFSGKLHAIPEDELIAVIELDQQIDRIVLELYGTYKSYFLWPANVENLIDKYHQLLFKLSKSKNSAFVSMHTHE